MGNCHCLCLHLTAGLSVVFRTVARSTKGGALVRILSLFIALAVGDAGAAADPRDELIQSLLQRLNQLEQRVQRQEEQLAALGGPGALTVATPPAAVAPPTSAQAAAPIAEVGDTADSWSEATGPTLTLRGFGDVQYRWNNGRAAHNAFALGQLDLFITSRITDEIQLLNENVLTADSRNHIDIKAERLLIRYSPSDYFSIAAGRYHSAIGFYNTAYHHGSWFQTAANRPLPFRGEDGGGVLPMHNVGLALSGLVPSGRLGLSYAVEVGNGREYRSGAEVQQLSDVDSRKSLNVALVARPEPIPGLQAGVSLYRDRTAAVAGPPVDQTILGLHLVYQRARIEWLNEAVFLRHEQRGTGARFNSHGFYSQFGHSFGAFRPYARYQLLDLAAGDPLLSPLGRSGETHGPSVGLRYNLSNFTALKFQYDLLRIEGAPSAEDFTLQWAFTF